MHIHRPNLHFQIVNALDQESLLQAAIHFGCSRPIAVVTEGLLPYLTAEEKETLAGNIHGLLGKCDGIKRR